MIVLISGLVFGVVSSSSAQDHFLVSPEKEMQRQLTELLKSQTPQDTTCHASPLTVSIPCTEAAFEKLKVKIERESDMLGRLMSTGYTSEEIPVDEESKGTWGNYKPIVVPEIGSPPGPLALVPIESLKGKKILSVGEGYSGFLPYLRLLGADVYGGDICYEDGKCGGTAGFDLGADRQCFKDRYIQQDATKLKEESANQYDLVYGSTLLCCLYDHTGFEGLVSMLQGTVKVLKAGGLARLTSGHSIRPEILASALKKIKKEFGNQVELSLYEDKHFLLVEIKKAVVKTGAAK